MESLKNSPNEQKHHPVKVHLDIAKHLQKQYNQYTEEYLAKQNDYTKANFKSIEKALNRFDLDSETDLKTFLNNPDPEIVAKACSNSKNIDQKGIKEYVKKQIIKTYNNKESLGGEYQNTLNYYLKLSTELNKI